jgi:selenocysteine lyase/cysteine desulfurase
MHANNEAGTIQPVEEISAVAQEHGIRFHTDAAQSVGKIPTKIYALGVDLLTIAGHKLYAPKGVGALPLRQHFNMQLTFLSNFELYFSIPVYPPRSLKIANDSVLRPSSALISVKRSEAR